jgi:hypothetical protein
MEIIIDNPPNIGRIRQFLNPPKNAVFAYGNKIYNPDNIKIWPDLEEHEKVHQRQQENQGGPDIWWEKYLQLPDFRLDQEIEAYATQLKFWKEKTNLNNKELKNILYEMAKALSNDYNLSISYTEAENKIRKFI